MALGVGLLPAPRLLTAAAPPWLHGDDRISRVDRHQRPAVPFGARLPARPPPTGRATRPLALGPRWIACGRARGGARVLLPLFLPVLDGRLQLPDRPLPPLAGCL
jgi:hypothetical protein